MTSPAIKLARECDAETLQNFGKAEPVAHLFRPQQLTRFYAIAQAQALRDAAESALKAGDNFIFTVHLKQMAEELERVA